VYVPDHVDHVATVVRRLAALDRATGAVRWRGASLTELVDDTGVIAHALSPRTAERLRAPDTSDRSWLTLDFSSYTHSGHESWRTEKPWSLLALGPDHVLAADEDRRSRAVIVDRSSGGVDAECPVEGMLGRERVCIARDVVVLVDRHSEGGWSIVGMSLDGALLWRYQVGADRVRKRMFETRGREW